MALYSGSVFGSISGETSGQVAAKWKGKDTFHKKVKQTDAKTQAQLAHRAEFKQVAELILPLLEQFIKPYWRNLPPRTTAYDECFKTNFAQNPKPQTQKELIYHTGKMRVLEEPWFEEFADDIVVWIFDKTVKKGESADDLFVLFTTDFGGNELTKIFTAPRSQGYIQWANYTGNWRKGFWYIYFIVSKNKKQGSISKFVEVPPV